MSALASVGAVELVAMRFGPGLKQQSSGGDVCQEVLNRGKAFQSRVEDMSRQLFANDVNGDPSTLSESDRLVYEIFRAVNGAARKLTPELRESLSFWVTQEMAARNAIERMAANAQKAS